MINFYAILSVVIVSFISFAGLFVLSINKNLLKKIIFVIVSLSVGALFGDTFIHLIPEAFESGLEAGILSILILAGIIFFFLLEKFMLWRHSHAEHDQCKDCGTDENRIKSLGPMILMADGIHNFIDGVIIGLSFLVSIEVGIATTLAIIFHEIPQEISDFGLLLHAGYSRAKALFLNFASAATAILGTVLALVIGAQLEDFIPYGLMIAAGGFIYIAGSDLVPELHKTKDMKKSLVQILAILLGLGLMFALLLFE